MSLFKFKGFLPFVLIMFLNSLVDIGHKITIQNVLYKSFDGDMLIILTAVVNLLILLPYVGMSSIAGFLNDKFSRVVVTRYAAASEAGLIFLIMLSYYFGAFYIAFGLTLLLAIQSAIYGPAKYGMIKKLVGVSNLGAANGIAQALVIIAILLASVGFSVIFEKIVVLSQDPSDIVKSVWVIGAILLVLSLIEFTLSFYIPMQEPSDKNTSFSYKKFMSLQYLKENMSFIRNPKTIWLCTLGLSFFWAISQLIIATFPAHYKAIMQSDNVIYSQAILALSIIGLSAGSFFAGNYGKNHIEMGLVPFGAFGMGVALFIFSISSNNFTMALASILFGFSGGLFIVPLNANIQYFSDENKMGRVLAGSNFVQNIFMIVFLILAILFVRFNVPTHTIFLINAIVIISCAIYAIKVLPHLFARLFAMPFLKFGYNVSVYGIENMPTKGGVLLLGNHVSWIDWAIIQIATPRPVKFVMYKSFYDLWYLRWFLKWFKVIPIGLGANKSAIEKMRELLENGEVVAVFPEGHITFNGQLAEFQKGFEIAVKETGAKIVPFYIRGLWGSSFSRSRKYFSEISSDGKRSISVSYASALPDCATASEVKKAVYELSFFSWGKYLNTLLPVQYNWLKNVKKRPFKQAMVDSTGAKLNNIKVLTAVILFINKLQDKLQGQRNVGVILPSSVAGSIINLMLMIRAKIPVNLNYTLSKENLLSCVGRAGIEKIITSRTFINKLSAKGFDLGEIKDKFIFLEDLEINKTDRFVSLLKALFMPGWLIDMIYFYNVNIDDDAVILFSSGSESAPKGVVLTHKNLMANIKQMAELVNPSENEAIMASLPIFHCFGLSVTTYLPLSEGILSIHVPDPTDAANVGKMAVKYGASILFGTSTFFRLYVRNKKLNHLMFKNIRLAIAGAEKLRSDVKNDFRLKFGIEILEGYGMTETTPVVSVNTPNMLEPDNLKELVFTKEGSVGMPLVGTIVKIVDQDSFEELPTGERGLILVGGHQVMRGYYKDEEKTQKVISKIKGVRFYNSGDIGYIDEDRFLYITDRLSRFAKIGGEMISLSAVEAKISEIFKDEGSFACLNLPDEKKGEKIVLFYSGEVADIQNRLKALPALMQPSLCEQIDELPMLASGKIDMVSLKKLAKEKNL
ncbi:MAG: MFS transporter [Campylobacter sp.]|nr:MFS transporter [Campylobacter sp.]